MKTVITGIWIAACVAAVAESPKIFIGGKELHNGKGENQSSSVYEFSGPYALRWNLRDVKPRPSEDPLAEYWKPHTAEKPPWVSIKVVDAASRKVVAHEMVTAWESSLQVKTGGKHYLIVTGEEHVAWTIWGKDGMLASNREGTRKPTSQDLGIASLEESADKIVAALKKQHHGRELEERLNAVAMIQSRASGTEDFTSRWRAYCKTMGWE